MLSVRSSLLPNSFAETEVFVTATGHYLPGPAVDNEQIESILGLVNGKPSRYKNKILKANGKAICDQGLQVHDSRRNGATGRSVSLRYSSTSNMMIQILIRTILMQQRTQKTTTFSILEL